MLGQHPLGEAVAEALDRLSNALDLDDVDAELSCALWNRRRRHGLTLTVTRRAAAVGRVPHIGLGGTIRGTTPSGRRGGSKLSSERYSTVTDLARLRGWSTSVPRATAVW